ncbi:ornithine cyclodeaminase family protein [Streptomyces sp. NPDC005438]|uniref:ornithine cyclodeaminase family protein n=1 Tax=Streptomyces sp. NPDC005438 TaxID=3156880 RepID=UPI0033BE3058
MAPPSSLPMLLGDEEVRAHLDAPTTLAAVRTALLDHHRGRLNAPARVAASLGDDRLVFTSGRGPEHLGFRAYLTTPDSDQLVAVWHRDGTLRALVYGRELGPRRTGAIGGVAVDVLARREASRLGVVGVGQQAWTQIWAIASVRRLSEVTLYGRRPDRAADLAQRVRERLGLTVRLAPSAEEAVREQDVVVTATSSRTPVIEPDWVAPGTHLNCLGPKSRSAREIPATLVERADLVVTDSLAQAAESGTGPEDGPLCDPAAMVGLGALVAGDHPGRRAPREVTLFASTGLAGTEVAVAMAAAERVVGPAGDQGGTRQG